MVEVGVSMVEVVLKVEVVVVVVEVLYPSWKLLLHIRGGVMAENNLEYSKAGFGGGGGFNGGGGGFEDGLGGG